MAIQIVPPWLQVINANGVPYSAAKLYVYATGTSTPVTTYSDSLLTQANTNPVIADTAGVFGAMYVALSVGDLKLVLKDSSDNTLRTRDPVILQPLTTDDLASLFSPQTEAEGTVSLTATDARYPPLNPYRYGADGTNGTSDTTAFASARTLDTALSGTEAWGNGLAIPGYTKSIAEIFAGIIPESFQYTSGEGSTLNVFRFLTGAQRASCIAEDGLLDMTDAIQAANDFLEGRSTASDGGGSHPGGTLYFPTGLYNIVGNLRVGGNVRWKGESLQSTVLSFPTASFTGTCITLGPDLSGIFPWSDHVFGAAIESMRISLVATNAHAVIIGTAGAHQGCHLYDLRIDGVNQIGIQLGDTGGPAYFWMKDIEIGGGTTESLPTTRQGIYTAMGSICEMDTISIEGASGHNFDIAIRQKDGSGQTRNLHFENCTTGVYFDTGGTNATSVINGISGNSTVTQLVWIPSGYTGTVVAMAINGRTGDPSHPIGIKNDNTGETLLNTMHGVYCWAGTAGDMSRIHNALQIVPASTITYSASMTPDASKASKFFITATNSTNFTINAPTTPTTNQRITFIIRNTSGGALGTATWNAVYKLATWTQPGSATSRSISFDFDGTNWVECSRTPADVAN